jgi:hypothetical protein
MTKNQNLPVPPCTFCGHVSEDPTDYRTDELTGVTVCVDAESCAFDVRETEA